MTRTIIIIAGRQYEDSDDCLADAAADVARELGLELWQVEACWSDEQLDEIIVTVPVVRKNLRPRHV
jgi:hypothetical protein